MSNVEQNIDRWSLDGRRKAAHVAVDWAKGLEGELLARVDAELTSAGLPTLTLMRDRYAYAGPLFFLPVDLTPEDRAAIVELISSLNIKNPNIVDMEWQLKDRSLLDVYTGYFKGRQRGGGDVVTLRRAG